MVNTATFSQMNIGNRRSDKLTYDLDLPVVGDLVFPPVSVVLDDTLYDANMKLVLSG